MSYSSLGWWPLPLVRFRLRDLFRWVDDVSVSVLTASPRGQDPLLGSRHLAYHLAAHLPAPGRATGSVPHNAVLHGDVPKIYDLHRGTALCGEPPPVLYYRVRQVGVVDDDVQALPEQGGDGCLHLCVRMAP